MAIERESWEGRRVMLTGHTGFKGAWLALWLQRLGARVSGVAPGPPSRPSVYELARVGGGMAREHAIDVRDREALAGAIASERPEVVMHLAAQPMVRRSLLEPAETFEVNVMGTVSVLEAVRQADAGVRAVVVVTSDKCYENPNTASAGDGALTSRDGTGARAFAEGDPLGGGDPYSASKACAEIVAAAYRRSFFAAPGSPRLATARAGNVIGGGDWGEDRLLADAVRVASGMLEPPLRVRNPDAVRPWQHVFNPLLGYLLLAQRLLVSERACGAWNFGPDARDARPVRWVLERLREVWGGRPEWVLDGASNPPEASRLELDSSRAQARLGWGPVWDLERALRELVRWHEAHIARRDMREVSVAQLEGFLEEAGAGAVV